MPSENPRPQGDSLDAKLGLGDNPLSLLVFPSDREPTQWDYIATHQGRSLNGQGYDSLSGLAAAVKQQVGDGFSRVTGVFLDAEDLTPEQREVITRSLDAPKIAYPPHCAPLRRINSGAPLGAGILY